MRGARFEVFRFCFSVFDLLMWCRFLDCVPLDLTGSVCDEALWR